MYDDVYNKIKSYQLCCVENTLSGVRYVFEIYDVGSKLLLND